MIIEIVVAVTVATLILLQVIMSNGGKKDMGCEYHGRYFVSYVFKKGVFSAHLHDVETMERIHVLRSDSYMHLQSDVAIWVRGKG